MAIVSAVAATVALSVLLACVVVWAPLLGLKRHGRVSLIAAALGITVAVVVILVQAGVALTSGMAPPGSGGYVVTTYFLAMANRLVGGPFAFSWTPNWMYPVGSLTALIPVGAVLTLAAGYSAHNRARRTTMVLMVAAGCLLAAYFFAAGYAAANTWSGIPV